MASLNFTTLDVFTRRKFAGNPLAVVHLPSSVHLTQTQKQTIAREFNYSETVFLHDATQESAGVPEWIVDIFTTSCELPFAGHPTIGTACHVLSKASNGKGRFRVKAGIIELEYEDGIARASIPHDTHVHGNHDLSGEKMLAWQPGLKNHVSTLKTEIVSPVKGMNFAIVELEDLEQLGALATVGYSLQAELDAGWDFGPLFAMFYVRLPEQGDDVRRLRTRMIEGTFEDPATGSASCGLAAYLTLKEGIREGTVKFELVQGVEMGRKSELGVEVTVEDGQIQTVVLSGKSVPVMQGKVFYE